MLERELGRMAQDYMYGRISRVTMLERMFQHVYKRGRAA